MKDIGLVSFSIIAAIAGISLMSSGGKGTTQQPSLARSAAIGAKPCATGELRYLGHGLDRYCIPGSWLDNAIPEPVGITLTYPGFIPLKELRSNCLSGPKANCFLVRITLQNLSSIRREKWPVYRCQTSSIVSPSYTDCHANFSFRGLFIGLQYPGALQQIRAILVSKVEKLVESTRR
jgi:hypothetical protein